MTTGADAALSEFRRTRRRRYVEDLDVMEVLYRVYVVVIFGGIALAFLAGIVSEAPVSASALEDVRVHAPPIIGIAVGLAILAGLRSGAHGGPLAIEPAEVQYTLLAPLSRGAALRPAAFSQLRIAAIAGAAVGAIVGNFVFRRFPGSGLEWIGCLTLFGALVPVCVLGGALLGSGRRLRPSVAALSGAALVAWSVADLAFGSTTSPATMLGELATLPLQHGTRVVLAAAGVAIAVFLIGFGLLGVGGILLEAARRRASLAAELRFSASVSDLRTVVLLRRQLASEQPRSRPWLRLRSGTHPVWRRGWQGLLRWPPVRIVRVLVLTASAGAVAVAAWSASVVLFVVPGLLLFVAALDLIEPLAQESDHPTRFELLPIDSEALFRRHLGAPTAALTAALLFASAVAAGLSGSAIALELGVVLALPTALVLATCAAFSATHDPFAYLSLPPGSVYAIAAGPPLVAVLAVGGPLLAARATWLHGAGAVPGAIAPEPIVLAVAAIAVFALGKRMVARAVVPANEVAR
jgi:hypothetical protein